VGGHPEGVEKRLRGTCLIKALYISEAEKLRKKEVSTLSDLRSRHSEKLAFKNKLSLS